MKRRYLSSLLAALAATVVIDAVAADPPMTAKEPRFPQLTVEQLNEQQKPLGEQILKVSSVALGGLSFPKTVVLDIVDFVLP